MRHGLLIGAITSLTLSACGVLGPDRGQEGDWAFLGLDGHRVTALAHGRSGLYAGTRSHGVFRFDEEGGAWEALGLDHAAVGAILVLPGEPERVLVGMRPRATERTEAALYVSDDSGATWAPSDGGLAAQYDGYHWAYSLARDPDDPDRLFWGSAASAYRSRDGGRSWELVYGDPGPGGGAIASIALSPLPDGRAWAGGQTSLFSPVVLRSDDAGESWHPSFPFGPGGPAVWALVPDPFRARRVWLGTSAGVYRSDDAGESWLAVLEPTTGDWSFSVRGLGFAGTALYAAVDEFRPDSAGMLTLTRLALYRALNEKGESWERIDAPGGVAGARALLVDDRGRLLIGTAGSGVWRFAPAGGP